MCLDALFPSIKAKTERLSTATNSPFQHKEGLSRTHVPFGGVVRDIKQRAQFFVSDYSDGICWKTLSASLYMFFATFASTVALGELARRQTDNHIGVTEYLLLQGGCGLIHALLAGQPLLILRPTGPITVFITELYTLSHRFKFDYFEWLACECNSLGHMLRSVM
eukprot:TRINITY_DN10511_c0_g2_i2.p2 TRINITY_DN10511_c0_g2~~TRINITY_DN10511_c0_g2_i2.p2  ORF type:complete len:165 (+),score=23.48 TRINITY_DN10511_c0_g2_i2:155-649(+)